MASPFSFFRKNQRAWMAGLVLVAIVSFVILPNFSFLGNNGAGPSRTGKTLVSWKGGRFSQDQLERLTTVHAQTFNILQRLANEVVRAGGRPNVPGFEMGPNGMSIGIQPPTGVESVVQLKVLSDTAAKHGVVVQDEAVDLFLRNFLDGKVSRKRFEEVVRETAGPSYTKHDMYGYLKQEISKQLVVEMSRRSMAFEMQPLLTPSKNWMNFQKFQQRAKIEAYPIFVQDFVDKVTGQPTEQEIAEIYEKGKDRYSSPYDPEAGFRRRYQADVEYVLADFNAFLKIEESRLTDDVLKAEYDKRVAAGQYRVPVEEFKATGEGGAPAGQAPTSPTDPPAATTDAPPADATATPGPATAEAPATTAPDAAPAAPSTEPAAVPPSDPADVPSAPVEPAAPPRLETPDSSSLRKTSPFKLVALQDEAAAPSAPATEVAPPADAGAPVDAPVAPAADTPAVTTDAPAASAPQTPAEPSTTEASTTEPSSTVFSGLEPPAPATDKPADKPMRTQTFDEVKDGLRRELALSPTREKMGVAVENVRRVMTEYSSQKSMYDHRLPSMKDVVEPTRPDLKQLAEQNGLSYGQTGMVNAVTVQDLPIGKSFTSSGPGSRGLDFNRFGDAVLTEQMKLELFSPQTAQGFEGGSSGTFLFWKTRELASQMPTLEQARDEIVAHWRLQRARRLASEQANSLASDLDATTDPDPWSKVLEEHLRPLVLKPAAFTWLQPMFTGTEGIQLSTVEGIDVPSQAFMEKAFTTPVGKAAVAMDAPEKRCYVIRVVERTPDIETLRADFERSPLNRNVMSLASQQSAMQSQSWLRGLIDALEIDASKLRDSQSGNDE